MKIISCGMEYVEDIRAIFNEAIVNSTALYDYRPRTCQMVCDWLKAKEQGGYPVLGIVSPAGELMGFASYGSFRAFPAYKYSVEHSLYVSSRFQGQGLGRRLLQEIIARAEEQAYHVLIGGIDSENSISKDLHRKFGFKHVGTIREAGFKFGRWLDLEFHQLILPTPAEPQDG